MLMQALNLLFLHKALMTCASIVELPACQESSDHPFVASSNQLLPCLGEQRHGGGVCGLA